MVHSVNNIPLVSMVKDTDESTAWSDGPQNESDTELNFCGNKLYFKSLDNSISKPLYICSVSFFLLVCYWTYFAHQIFRKVKFIVVLLSIIFIFLQMEYNVRN